MSTPIVALDAGHGLKTAGKQTPDGIKEWTLNDKVRDKVVTMLKDYDVSFIFPDNNEGNTDEALTKRRTMYVNKGVAAAVSIHHNANTGTWNSATGVEIFTDKNATAKDKALAEAIYKRLVSNTGLRGRGIKQADWTVIDQDKIPAVLVEGGFMDSKTDYPVITSDAGQTAYAKAIAEGLIEFLKLKKKAVPAPTTKSSFIVKFKEDMNVRKGPGIMYQKVVQNGQTVICKKDYKYTIVETTMVESVPWGKLKSGAGWVAIADVYCTVV